MTKYEYLKEQVQMLTTNPVSACVEWPFSVCKGYGYCKFEKKHLLAHRQAYMWTNNVDLSVDELVCHTCDNRRCFNPLHLWVGTNRENTQDRIAKGRSNWVRGSRCGNAKVTEANVSEIRRLYAEGMKQREIAKRFQISDKTVSAIVLRKSWKHVQ